MKGTLYVLGIWLLLSCSRTPDPQASLQGTYVGTFQRDNGGVSQVELTFTGNHYEGKVTAYPTDPNTSSAIPVICQGTFTASGKTINFQNECVFTANFDWTLILSQEWLFSSSNKSLALDRSKDHYALTKQ